MSVANYATVLAENNNSNLRLLANQITFQTWGTKKVASGVVLDSNLAAASNVTVMTIRAGNVGIGSTSPTAALDVVGNVNVSGNFTRNGVMLAATNWQTNGTITYLTAGNQLGIGTSTTAGNDIYVAGTISANNVFARNAFFIANDNQAVRNALQVAPVKANVIVSSATQSTFTIQQEGLYTAHASNADVYINGLKLVYASPTQKDYDLTFGWSGTTTYTITLSQPALYGDVIDISVWPSFYNTASTNLPGYVYQTFSSYQWSNVGIGTFYTLGNVGIGTSTPKNRCDVRGNMAIGLYGGPIPRQQTASSSAATSESEL